MLLCTLYVLCTMTCLLCSTTEQYTETAQTNFWHLPTVVKIYAFKPVAMTTGFLFCCCKMWPYRPCHTSKVAEFGPPDCYTINLHCSLKGHSTGLGKNSCSAVVPNRGR
uniref:Secreted protein n=1 Tax=Anguilla anguilla TaxID=7936 RepID=A0A0E9WNP4_ANGAN